MNRIEAIIKFAEKAIIISNKVATQDIIDHPAYEVVKDFVPGAKAILEIGRWWSEYREKKVIPQEAIALICRKSEIPEHEYESIETPDQLNDVLKAHGITNPESLYEREVNLLFSQAKYPELTRLLLDQHKTVLSNLEQQFDALQRSLQEGFLNLWPIEKILEVLPQSNNEREPQFFRKSGPYIVDFEAGYIHRRPEVDLVMEKFAVEPAMLLIGAGASGKSVVARQAAYELWRKGWTVYLISLSQSVERTALQQELERLGDGENLVVIEDVHLNPTVINELIKATGSNWPKLLLTTRSIDLEYAFRKEIIPNQIKRLPRLELEPLDASDPIIRLFTKEQGIELTPHLRETLIEVTGGSLWLLAYALKAMKDTGQAEVKRELILKEVERDLQKIWDDNEDINYPKVLIALSVLYRKEEPTDAYFLEQSIPGARDVLNQLSRLGEVREIDSQRRLYGLPHSALADLYYEFTNGSAWDDSLYSDTCLFLHNYLTSDLAHNGVAALMCKEAGWVIAGLQFHDILRIARRMEATMDLNDAAKVIESINKVDPEKAQALLAALNLPDFARHIEKAEKLWKAAAVIASIHKAAPEEAQALVAELNPSEFDWYFDKPWNLKSAPDAIETIYMVDQEKAQALVAELNPSDFARYIVKTEYLRSARKAIESIRWLDPEKAQAILSELNPSDFARYFEKTENLMGAAIFIEYVHKAAPEKAQAIVSELNLPDFARHIERPGNLRYAAAVIESIHKAAPEKAQALVSELNLSDLARYFEKGEKLWDAATVIESIHRVNPEKAQALVAELNPSDLARHFEKPENLWHAAAVIESINKVDPEKAQALLAELNPSDLARHLKNPEKLWDAAKFIESIHKAAPKKAQALLAELNPSDFARYIEKSDNLSLGELLFREMNYLETVAEVIVSIHKAAPEKAQALAAALNLPDIARHIERPRNLRGAAKVIESIHRVDPEKGKALVAEIDTAWIQGLVDYLTISDRCLRDKEALILLLIEQLAFR